MIEATSATSSDAGAINILTVIILQGKIEVKCGWKSSAAKGTVSVQWKGCTAFDFFED